MPEQQLSAIEILNPMAKTYKRVDGYLRIGSFTYLETMYGDVQFSLQGSLLPNDISLMQTLKLDTELMIRPAQYQGAEWKRVTVSGWQTSYSEGGLGVVLVGRSRLAAMSDQHYGEFVGQTGSAIISSVLKRYEWDMSAGTASTTFFSFSQAGRSDSDFVQFVAQQSHINGEPLYFWFLDGWKATLARRIAKDAAAVLSITLDDPQGAATGDWPVVSYGDTTQAGLDHGFRVLMKDVKADKLIDFKTESIAGQGVEILPVTEAMISPPWSNKVSDGDARNLAESYRKRLLYSGMRMTTGVLGLNSVPVNTNVALGFRDKMSSNWMRGLWTVYGVAYFWDPQGTWKTKLFLEREANL